MLGAAQGMVGRVVPVGWGRGRGVVPQAVQHGRVRLHLGRGEWRGHETTFEVQPCNNERKPAILKYDVRKNSSISDG